jgi:hypothetical protein
MTILLRVKERIVGPSGYFNIQNEWYGYADEFKYTIGLAGLMGFGVGCCRPELLPARHVARCRARHDRWSANYGTYIHLPSASIHVLRAVPLHGRAGPGQHRRSDLWHQGGDQQHPDQATAVLPKAFQNDGSNLAGVFIDKYQGSNCKPDGSGQAEP